MYQKLLRKIAEEKPSYNQEEIQWLLDHLGDPSPEIRDDLVFTSFARGIQEELFTQEQFHFIAEGISSDGGLDKDIDKVGLSTLERFLGRLFMQISCLQMPTSNRFFIRN